jgi:TolB-like protein/Flp pilus assembly protein TadD
MAFMETCGSDVVRSQLDKILLSEGFARNNRLSGFLRFVVEQELLGLGDQLKESVIGVEVFGRRPDYDVRQDSVVRTEAARLRARLAEYYASHGSTDALIIDLPKGGYKPQVRRNPVSASTLPSPPGTSAPDVRARLPRRVWLSAALACLTLAALFWWRLHQNANIPIAVLPLNNLSQDPANEYFTDGLTGEIIRNLSIIDGLAVRSQTSSFLYKGKPHNVHDAGRQLDAEYILEGSVLRSGQQLRINAQLVRVRDDFPLWSAKYDRELNDVFAIQDEISRGIVNSLRLKLGRGRRRYETSVEAYDLYLRARTFGADLRRAMQAFREAIARDPSFAPAYAGLASAHAYRSGFDKFDQAQRADVMSQMRAAAEKAIQLDPLLAEAHGALGMVYACDAQWSQAEKSFRRAIELDPGDSVVRQQFSGNLLLPLGRIKEAVAQMRLAEKSDPLSSFIQDRLARTLFIAGHYNEAVAHCEKPCVDALLLQGRAAEAIPILEARYKGDLSASGSGELGRAYALAGRREDAEKIAAVQWRPIEQAGIFIALGDKDRAIEALNRGIPLGPVRIGRDLTHPEFSPLRGDPRIKALRKKVGLPE